MDFSNLKFVPLPGVNPPKELVGYYKRAFAHWESVWTKTFQELDGVKKIFTDNFTRQDEIFTRFDDLTCVAMVCHRYVEVTESIIYGDSYFDAWPRAALDQLVKHGDRLLIANQISVLPDRRGRAHGLSLKDLMSAMTMSHLRRIEIDVMPGTMRADKNMQSFLYDCGAQPIQKNVMFHNVPVDLLAFYPQVHPIRMPDPVEQAVQALWDNRRSDPPLDVHLKKTERTIVKQTGESA